MELGAVADHQGERVPAPEAQLGEAAGERIDAIAQFAPGDRELIALGADGDIVLALGGGERKASAIVSGVRRGPLPAAPSV